MPWTISRWSRSCSAHRARRHSRRSRIAARLRIRRGRRSSKPPWRSVGGTWTSRSARWTRRSPRIRTSRKPTCGPLSSERRAARRRRTGPRRTSSPIEAARRSIRASASSPKHSAPCHVAMMRQRAAATPPCASATRTTPCRGWICRCVGSRRRREVKAR